MRGWYRSPFDPDDFNEFGAQRAVKVIAIRRYVGKAAYETSRVRH